MYKYYILRIETQEGGCYEEIIHDNLSIEEAINIYQKLVDMDNSSFYIVLDI